MLALTYKWTLDYIDSLTWPMIQKLLRRIKENPPVDLIAGAFMKAQAPKPIGQQIGSMGFPVKKGKVKRRK